MIVALIYRIFLRMAIWLRIYLFFSRNPKITFAQSNDTFKSGAETLCVFASYSSTTNVSSYIFNYLEKLAESGVDIVFISTAASIGEGSLEKLKLFCMQICTRKNAGLDFGSWKAGLLYSGVEWQKYKKILFANDSCYAPLYPMTKILQQDGHGVVSITDSLEQEPHLMSYFLLCHQDVIRHPDFLKFWQDVRMVPTRLKGLIVQLYEIGFSRYFKKRGFDLKATYPIAEIGRELGLTETGLQKINPTHRFWHYLIEAKKCPILKVDLFKRFFIPENDQSWRNVIANTDYDERLIQEHQNLLRNEIMAHKCN